MVSERLKINLLRFKDGVLILVLVEDGLGVVKIVFILRKKV